MKIQVVGVIGAGVMGQGIAQLAAQSGFQTHIFDAAVGQAQLAYEKINSSWDKLQLKGRFTSGEIQNSKGNLSAAHELDDLKNCDLIIEAIVENLDIKQSVFKALEGICKDDAILCSNTSSLSITDLSEGLERPENFAGLHFFNPAPIMKLVELIPTENTINGVVRNLKEAMDRMGKISVQAKDSPGFIVNRCARPFYSEALVMLEEGVASVDVIDKCLKSGGGFPLGPFQLIDLVGLDINLKATETVWEAFDKHARFEPSNLLREMHGTGHLGRKTSKGFYDYSTSPLNEHNISFSGNEISIIKLAKSTNLDIIVVQSGEQTAAEVSKEKNKPALVLDHVLHSFEKDKPAHIACAMSGINLEDQARIKEVFAIEGIELQLVEDQPGLIMTRMIAALLSEADYAQKENVAKEEDIDISLRAGLNFKFGPFEAARIIGLDKLKNISKKLYYLSGQERYSNFH